MWGDTLPKNRFLCFWVLLAHRYLKHNVATQSAALAFYLLFMIFPFLIFISALLGLLNLNVAGIVSVLADFLQEVVLEFPIATESDHAQKVQALPEEEETASPLSGMKFLCAEDNAINAEILELLLESKGAHCKIYPNGQEIVDAFASVKPGEYDMILMDVQMPVMDGLEATRRIRSGENPLGRIIPILAMTANAFLEDMQKSKEAGMDEHLSKPVDIAALEQTVKRFRVTSSIKK